MKLGLILLISITGILLSISLPHAYSELVSGNKYLLQATGFVAGTQTIQNSEIDLQFSTGSSSNGNTPITVENGLVSISGNNYLNSGIWTSTILRDGMFLVVTGDAQNSNGDTIHLNLFGRLVGNSQDGSVYYFTGKITGTTESLKVIYSVRIASTTVSNITPPTQTPTQTPPTQTPPTQTPSTQVKTAQISILQGASDFKTGQFLSPSSVQVNPGSAIIWTNNDSVPHRIQSGYLSTTTKGQGGSATLQSHTPSYQPDGKIDSGVIAPGQTFQFTISGTGTTSFYDPTYTWINGVIASISPTSAQTKPIQVSIEPGSSLSQGSASQQNQFYYNRYFVPSTLQIVPGTTIVWTNNDSVPHRILSGLSTQKPQNPFTPDGKIDSGVIASGQTFQFTINDVGIIRYYDPTYPWMNALIVSIPSSSSHTIAAPSHNPSLH
jgi:plastocyanin